MTISVKDYLQKMDDKYLQFRGEWGDLDRRWNAEETHWDDEVRRGWNDMGKKLKAQQEHHRILQGLKAEFSTLQDEAKTAFDEILTDADRAFERYSRPVPEKIDSNMVELLRSGILSDDELLSSVEDYRTNITMLRQFAPYLDARARVTKDTHSAHELSALAAVCRNADFDYKTPLTTFADLAVSALHSDAAWANAYDHELSAQYPQLLEAAKALVAVVEGGRRDE